MSRQLNYSVTRQNDHDSLIGNEKKNKKIILKCMNYVIKHGLKPSEALRLTHNPWSKQYLYRHLVIQRDEYVR